MTASVVNLQKNNLEEMFSVVKNTTEKTDVTLDKTKAEFEKALNKSIEKTQENNNANNCKVINDNTVKDSKVIVEKNEALIKSSECVSLKESLEKLLEDGSDISLEDSLANMLKDVLSYCNNTTELTENLVEFRDVLSKMIEDVNNESSLDLSLSKDVNVIISQLKDAIENIAEIIERLDEQNDTNSVDNTIIAELFALIDNRANLQIDEKAETNTNNSNEENIVSLKVPFEQTTSFYKLATDAKNEVIKEQENKKIDLETLEQSEIIEFSENIVEEVVVDKTSENIVEEVAVDKTSEKTDLDEFELKIDEEILKELKIESLQTQADTAGGETLMQQQTPEEVAVKAMINKDIENFDVKLETTQSIQSTTQSQVKPIEINPSRILEQISKQLEGLQNGGKVNIVLNPESLGKVNIQLLSTKEGLMAQLIVTTQEAKDILMKGLDGLKDSLLAQGVGVDNVSVKVADAQKSEYNQDWTEQEGSRGGNKGQKNPDREEKEKGLFEKMMQQTLDNENGNV